MSATLQSMLHGLRCQIEGVTDVNVGHPVTYLGQGQQLCISDLVLILKVNPPPKVRVVHQLMPQFAYQ